ncbi:Hpt domain-containing protein [Capillimicrobium parvum]|uniref:Hpt domain-containing protein n=1 Tax=Capillimicrobium parvum TaxID=2884022 RepID=UPI00216AC92B|nr:Hpt domain-containing protein [Capillimicrobium parvum]
MSDDVPADVRDVLRRVWESRRDNVLARVDVIDATIAAARVGALDDEQRAAGVREAHMLSGSAGTFGFGAATAMARELEHAFDVPGGPPSAALDHLGDVAGALRRELEGEPAGGAEGWG